MRRPSAKRLAIYSAIVANVAIATTKLVAAAVGGSAAMLSEGLHSVVDTGDSLLLLVGLHLAKRPATTRHPYGHGLEVYFWSMIVAMSIFGMGGGVSIYEGVSRAVEHRGLATPGWSYAVLAVAFLFEGVSWLISMRSFAKERRGRGLWQTIVRSKDPTTFMVVLEDSAGMLGVVFAATGLGLSSWLDAPIYDALASIAVGLVLVGVAFILGRETRSLLIGESASPELKESIRRLAGSERAVLEVREPRTMHIGPDVVHVDLDVRLDPALSGRALIDAMRGVEAAVRSAHPEVRRVSLGVLP
jgi:cation diffusion facilitator family transporter